MEIYLSRLACGVALTKMAQSSSVGTSPSCALRSLGVVASDVPLQSTPRNKQTSQCRNPITKLPCSPLKRFSPSFGR
jgi:hypothetical protein